MNRIKFHSDNNHERQFAEEVRKRVRAYFKENKISRWGNFNMYLKTLVTLSLYLAPFAVLLTVNLHPLAALGMAILLGIGEAGIGMSIMHDGAHGSYSSKSWVNKLAASTMFLLGSNTFNWKIQHNIQHHTFTNIFNSDPDISIKNVIRLSEHAPYKKYHRYQHIFAFPLYGLMTLARFLAEINTLISYTKQGITRERNVNSIAELVKLIATKIVYLFIIIGFPLLFTDFSIGQILIGFAIMHIVAGGIMGTVFQMAHVVEGAEQPLPDSNNMIHTEWMVHQLNTTSDFGRKSGLFSWYIGGLNFQIEHHLFQNVCHVHYPAIAPIVQATAEEYGFTYNLKPTVFHALISHFHRLKELGKNNLLARV